MIRNLNARLDAREVMSLLKLKAISDIPQEISCPLCHKKAYIDIHPYNGLYMNCSNHIPRMLLELVFELNPNLAISYLQEQSLISHRPIEKAYLQQLQNHLAIKQLIEKAKRLSKSDGFIFQKLKIFSPLSEKTYNLLNSYLCRIIYKQEIQQQEIFSYSTNEEDRFTAYRYFVAPLRSFDSDISKALFIPDSPDEDIKILSFLSSASAIMWFKEPKIGFVTLTDFILALEDSYREDLAYIGELKSSFRYKNIRLWGLNDVSLKCAISNDLEMIPYSSYSETRKDAPLILKRDEDIAVVSWAKALQSLSEAQIKKLELDEHLYKKIFDVLPESKREALRELIKDSATTTGVIINNRRVFNKSDGLYILHKGGQEEKISDVYFLFDEVLLTEKEVLFKGKAIFNGESILIIEFEDQLQNNIEKWIKEMAYKHRFSYPIISKSWLNKIFQISLMLSRPKTLYFSDLYEIKDQTIKIPTATISYVTEPIYNKKLSYLPFGITHFEKPKKTHLNGALRTTIAALVWQTCALKNNYASSLESLVFVGEGAHRILDCCACAFNLQEPASPLMINKRKISSVLKKEIVKPGTLFKATFEESFALSVCTSAFIMIDYNKDFEFDLHSAEYFAYSCFKKLALNPDYLKDIEDFLTYFNLKDYYLYTYLSLRNKALNFFVYLKFLEDSGKIALFSQRKASFIEKNDAIYLDVPRLIKVLKIKNKPYPNFHDIEEELQGICELKKDGDYWLIPKSFMNTIDRLYEDFKLKFQTKYSRFLIASS